MRILGIAADCRWLSIIRFDPTSHNSQSAPIITLIVFVTTRTNRRADKFLTARRSRDWSPLATFEGQHATTNFGSRCGPCGPCPVPRSEMIHASFKTSDSCPSGTDVRNILPDVKSWNCDEFTGPRGSSVGQNEPGLVADRVITDRRLRVDARRSVTTRGA